MTDEIVRVEAARRATERGGPVVTVGDWYWVRSEDEGGEEEGREWLGCVVHVGTNYVKIEGPVDGRCTHGVRVLLAELEKWCRRESDAAGVIAAKVVELREVVAGAVRKIGAVSARLRLGEASADVDTKELSVYDGSSMGEYKKELVAAQKEVLPALRKEIQEACAEMAAWMQAESMPIVAQERHVKRALASVESRISGVEIYAGLVEHAEQVKGGDPAGVDEPVYLFQRRLYMDEECLANYQAGGMTFRELGQFEEWLLRPDNLGRIMPRPRCAVAFRVRREEREDEDSCIGDFVRMMFDGENAKNFQTYLYLRNGDRVSRIRTDVDFGEKLFPDAETSIFRRGKLYAVMFVSSIQRLATEDEYLDLRRREEERRREAEATPEEERFGRFGFMTDESDRWVPWDEGSVYYDDVTEYVRKAMSDHNRLVLLLQGLLDRSDVLSPHPPCSLWQPEDFVRTVRLVFDDDRALVSGDRPDFEAYRAEVNRKMRAGCLCVGQGDYWGRREAVRENERLVRRYGHEKSYYMQIKRMKPDEDDPGPGVVARAVEYRPGRGCTFEWERRRRSEHSWRDSGKRVKERMVVPVSELLCVDGYRPGDYHRFYDDPRTRADYVKWAPLLLRAEEWYAGARSKK